MVIRVTVCQTRDTPDDFARDWDALAAHVRKEESELILLPEMACAPWFAVTTGFDRRVWQSAIAAHDEWIARFSELVPAFVAGSRPVERDGRRLNEAFVWDSAGGYRPIHQKYFLPREEGFWETSWYDRGDGSFTTASVGSLVVGALICTELWSLGHAQAYGKAGVDALLVPRASSRDTVDKWLAGGRVASVVAGAYSLSSNRSAPPGGADLGGGGWIVSPDGDVLGQTSVETPFVTATIDTARAARAKSTYPRYVLD